jgi:hypothetical protein
MMFGIESLMLNPLILSQVRIDLPCDHSSDLAAKWRSLRFSHIPS